MWLGEGLNPFSNAAEQMLVYMLHYFSFLVTKVISTHCEKLKLQKVVFLKLKPSPYLFIDFLYLFLCASAFLHDHPVRIFKFFS